MLHARLLLLLVPDAVIHVRFELLLTLVSVSEFKFFLALINPLRNPPQLAGIISLGCFESIGGLLLDPLMLQYLLQSCSRTCVCEPRPCVYLLLQYHLL